MCIKCFTTEKHNGISDRMNFNRRYQDTLLEPNIETGNQYNSPIDLDIRPGNLCNLKCRMCGPHSSSQLQKEALQNPDLFKGFHLDIYDTEGVFSEKNLNFLLKNVDKGEHIKFLGGEPTLMPEVSDILDKLIETNNTSVPIHITTNCTNTTEQFMNKLKQFTRLTFNYSVDGTDKVVEYIRHPVKFNTIDNNIRLYKNIAEDDNISFVLQAYNLFNLYDTIKWSADIEVRVHTELLQTPRWCSVLCIPKEIRDKELYKTKELVLNEEYSEWVTNPNTNIIPTIDRILEDDREYSLKYLTRNTKRFDTARRQHIKDYIPEVWEIIKDEYNGRI
jgi:sulfatase maturation enzyme AslB (radical SAM superfamily)